MKILVLGAGMQGKAALHDLAHSPEVKEVIAADADLVGLNAFVAQLNVDKIRPVGVDAADLASVGQLMQQVDAAIVLLSPALTPGTARIAVENGCHWVDASYSTLAYEELSGLARDKGVALLPEFGLDPGIDLVLAAAALNELQDVEEFYSYGAGVPEPEAANNVLKYKISWTFAGVLNSYSRSARFLRDGQVVDVTPDQLFEPGHVHEVDIEGVGKLEAYPNGDAVKYLKMLGLMGKCRQSGRFSMRWPGHSALWRSLVALGMLSDEPILVGGTEVVPRQFLHDLLSPQLQYLAHERDIAIVRVDATGNQDGKRRRVVYQVVDRRDLGSGLLAMQRTVGYTASIGAQMIVRGDIRGRGLLSPLRDVPAQPFFEELGRRGIRVERMLLD
jgi:saccharopine dehydrogenase-like NADP-dependent oxidoreductase